MEKKIIFLSSDLVRSIVSFFWFWFRFLRIYNLTIFEKKYTTFDRVCDDIDFFFIIKLLYFPSLLAIFYHENNDTIFRIVLSIFSFIFRIAKVNRFPSLTDDRVLNPTPPSLPSPSSNSTWLYNIYIYTYTYIYIYIIIFYFYLTRISERCSN